MRGGPTGPEPRQDCGRSRGGTTPSFPVATRRQFPMAMQRHGRVMLQRQGTKINWIQRILSSTQVQHADESVYVPVAMQATSQLPECRNTDGVRRRHSESQRRRSSGNREYQTV